MFMQMKQAQLKKTEEENFQVGNLTEKKIYYRSNSKYFFGKILSVKQYFSLSEKSIKQYFLENGNPDYVHVQVPIRAGLLAMKMKNKFNIPYALTEHYGIYNDVAEDSWNRRSKVYRNSVKKIIAGADPLICVSRQLGQEMNELVLKKDFIMIPNVVESSVFQFNEKNSRGDKFRFIHVSNMSAYKNVEGIIEAAKNLAQSRSDFELRLVGKIPKTYFQLAEHSGLLDKQIFFTGEIPYHRVADEMNEADAFILFSKSESSSCVIQEALSCGLPVITTPVGIALETINASNGLLTELGNTRLLTVKMNELMNSYSQFNRKRISEEWNPQFSYEILGKKIAELYK